MHHNHEPDPIPEGSKYEGRDVKAVPIWRAIMWFFIGTAVMIFVSVPILNGLSCAHTEFTGSPEFREGREIDLPPDSAPKLQTNVTKRVDTFKLGREAREKTETYGWVDEGLGKARVPVKRAMDDVAAAGQLPRFPKTVPKPADDRAVSTQQPIGAEGGQNPTS